MTTQNQRFAEVGQVPTICPFLKRTTIRWWIYKDEAFRRQCVFRVGRKILIGVPELLEFIQSRKG